MQFHLMQMQMRQHMAAAAARGGMPPGEHGAGALPGMMCGMPPPFPTGKPFRAYASNIVVDREHRRAGLASLMVGRCELLASLWGEESLWLHVENDNRAAVSLYDKLNYVQMDYFALYGNGKTELRSKTLPKRPAGERPPPPQASLGRVNADNVFVWK